MIVIDQIFLLIPFAVFKKTERGKGKTKDVQIKSSYCFTHVRREMSVEFLHVQQQCYLEGKKIINKA